MLEVGSFLGFLKGYPLGLHGIIRRRIETREFNLGPEVPGQNRPGNGQTHTHGN